MNNLTEVASLRAIAVMKYADEVMKYDKELAYKYYDEVGELLGLKKITSIREKCIMKQKERAKDEYEADDECIEQPYKTKHTGRLLWGGL